MWGSFFLSVAAGIIFFYFPGYVLLRAFCPSRLFGLVVAPLVSAALYSLLCIVFSKAEVFVSWAVLAGSAALVSAVVFIVSIFAHLVRSRHLVRHPLSMQNQIPSDKLQNRHNAEGWAGLALYVFTGFAVTLVFLVANLDGPDSFIQEYDNVHHLGVIQSFIESGDWSSLAVTLYPGRQGAEINPLPGTSFYPAFWHCLAALIVDAFGVPVPLAENAVNFVFVAIVFPSNMFLLMRTLFEGRQRVIFFGAFCTLAFSAFPWALLTFGPLYPNLAAFAMVPSMVACFVLLLGDGAGRMRRVALSALFFVGLISLAFTQPNAVFTVGVILVPFCIWRAMQAAERFESSRISPRARKTMAVATLLAVVCLIWAIAFNVPFMQGVVGEWWASFTSKSQAIVNIITLSFVAMPAQIILSVLVVVGIICSIRNRTLLWISCSYAIICIMFFFDAATDNVLKSILTGFWYTDKYRVAAMAVICAVPLAALGLSGVAQAIESSLKKANSLLGKTGWLAFPCFIAVLFVIANFYPSYSIPGRLSVETAFGSVGQTIRSMNDTAKPAVYDKKERSFIDQVEHVVPSGSVIINVPDDGSAFAYGADGLGVLYRYLRTYGEEDETQDSRTIRESLNKINTNTQVQSAVKNIGAEYVLLLDGGMADEGKRHLFTYQDNKEKWAGIEAINDETPGFEVVLAQDGMRLYRIKAA